MKCPKCGYLGFEQPERCRNCGYEFALSSRRPEPELALRDDRDVRSIGELDLRAPASRTPGDLAGNIGRATGGNSRESLELPLFTDDIPLITKPSPPRAPLSVRRSTPEIPRLRSETPRAVSLTFHAPEPPANPELPANAEPNDPPAAETDPDPEPAPAVRSRPDRGERLAAARLTPSAAAADLAPAGLIARWCAGIIDLTLLAAVDLAVLYFTLQICGLTAEEWHLLPRGPLLAFLVVQNGGYLVAFTAGGQTIGKMLTGIKVIAADPDQVLDLGRALQRTLLWAVMALPAGLGLLSALLTTDRRGLHDRLAGTRVVRAVL